MENESLRPIIKFTRCSRRKPTNAKTTVSSPNTTVKRSSYTSSQDKKPVKRRRKTNNNGIPIPSFSPLDASILDTPPPKGQKKEAIVWDDADDDDDLLLEAPPIFGAPKAETIKSTKVRKQTTSAKDNNDNRETKSSSPEISSKTTTTARKTLVSSTSDNVMQLAREVMHAIDTLLNQVDISKVTLRDIVNDVLTAHKTEHSHTPSRKAIRDYIKARMQADASQNDNDLPADDFSSPVVDIEQVQSVAGAQIDDASMHVEMDSSKSKHNADKTTEAAAARKVDEEALTRKRKTDKSRLTIKPDKDTLIVSIDGLLLQADPKTTTLKDFIMSLEAEFDGKLHKDSRALVKRHLAHVFSGKVESSDSLPLDVNEKVEAPNSKVIENNTADTGEVEDSLEKKVMSSRAVSCKGTSSDKATDEVPSDSETESEDEAKGVTMVEVNNANALVVELDGPAKLTTRKRARTRKPTTQKVDVQNAEKPKPAPKPKCKPPRRTAKIGKCALCTTCTCSIGKKATKKETPDASFSGMSRTEADMERALIRRAKQLEGIIDRYEGMLHQVKKELKKHRLKISKKQEAQLNDGKQLAFGDSRFLPDADDWDIQAESVRQEALPKSLVDKAQGALFAYHGNRQQPTLTQMFGNSNKKNNDVEEETEEVNAEESSVVLEVQSPSTFHEDEESALGHSKSVDDYVPVDPYASPDRVHRLSWRQGERLTARSPLLRGSGVWAALTTNAKITVDCLAPFPQRDSNHSSPNRLVQSTSDNGNYVCAWDSLFSDHLTSDDAGMSQLLEIFENDLAYGDRGTPTKELALSEQAIPETPELTQSGESLAVSIEETVSSDYRRLQAIEAACPNWRENIRYAVGQREEDEICEALKRVRRAMKKLATMRKRVNDLWERQEVVLQLFETLLCESLTRSRGADLPKNDSKDESHVVSTTASTSSSPPPSPLQSQRNYNIVTRVACD